jgi:hypothetical protein
VSALTNSDSFGKETNLTDDIVHFVGASVVPKWRQYCQGAACGMYSQILPLQPNTCAARIFRKVLGEVELRRAIDVPVIAPDLLPKLGIRYCLSMGFFKFT